MVRRNELACRDQWAHDLWVDAEGDDAATADAAPGPIGRLTARPERPATAGEIAAVVQAQTAPAERDGEARLPEDVVVGETLVIAERERDWEWQREDAAASRVVDTRSAIIKARETYRDRARSGSAARAEARAPLSAQGEEPATVLDAANGTPGADEASATAEATASPAPPDPSLRRVRAPSSVAFDGFDDVPPVVPGFSIPSVERRPNVDEPSTGGREPVLSTDEPSPTVRRGEEAAGPVAERERRGGSGPVRAMPEADRASAGYARRQVERRPLEPALVPVRVERASSPAPRYRSVVDETGPDLDLTEERREDATTLVRGRRGPFRHDPSPVPVREVAERWGAFGDEEGPPSREVAAEAEAAPAPEPVATDPGEDIVLPTRRGDREPPVDTTIRVAPDLPRICRTCRDYRPAEGGARGWCANEWAFTHRRVVDPDERMPCETSLGSWWLPADAIWLASTDVSAHGQPTPILDAVVAHHRSEPLQRRGS
jgi:hypothetical protein